jgi:DNA-binding beta-propeller fold protein YncE
MAKRFEAGDYKYEHVEGWGAFPAAGVVSDIACDSQNRVYACVRLKQGPDGNEGEIWVLDRDGKHVKSWAKGDLEVPHGMWIGPDDDVYHTDAGDHTVTKFDTDGNVLMTLGSKGKQGPAGEPFRSPTRAVLSSSGEIFVSDGYQQNRCHRFTAGGELILSWGQGDPVYYEEAVIGEVTGTPGTGPGEFNLPHDITVDRNDLAYVLDRENDRLQVFDNEGRFIEQWTDVPGGNDSVIDENDLIHIATGHSGIQVRTLDGDSVGTWGESGEGPGQFRGAPHGIWIDSRGDVYVAEVGAQLALNKFARL